MEKFITVKGAREHNLKGLDVRIPHGKLTVITGVSGSGKSSLAFDTIFAEGQRRFIESMSAYARQFLGRLDKPAIDDIKGLSPAIAIQQKVSSGNPRSTIGTSTEIYDYLKLLYARIGNTYSPISGNPVRQDQTKDVLTFLDNSWKNNLFAILYPLNIDSLNNLNNTIQSLNKEGFTRLFLNENFVLIDDVFPLESLPQTTPWVVVDRLKNEPRELPQQSRLAEGIERAFVEGKGECSLYNANTHEFVNFSARFEADGLRFETPSPAFFAFNNPYGACKKCEGYGMTLGIDEELVFPDRSKSIYEGAVAPWKGENMQEYQQTLLFQANKFDFPIHRPIQDLSPEQYALLWTGNHYFVGLNEFFKFLESQTYKIQYRVMLSRYRGKTECHECRGTRLRGDASYVKIEGLSIQDCVLMPITKIHAWFKNLKLSNKIRFVHNRSDEHYLLNFEHLHVVNHCPLSYINKSKNVATLKSIFHKLTPIRNRSQNFLIFCSRRSFSAKNGRNITEENENEIIEYLKQYSVQNNLEFYLLTGEEPDGSTVSIEKQYELFTNAEIVVGLHGGVMNNLIFLDPAKKPKVIEFCPSESKNFSRLFDGAIDVFAKYYKIPYIIPIEAQKEIADESVESLKTAKIISILQKINCSIDVSELKKILLTLNKKLILD